MLTYVCLVFAGSIACVALVPLRHPKAVCVSNSLKIQWWDEFFWRIFFSHFSLIISSERTTWFTTLLFRKFPFVAEDSCKCYHAANKKFLPFKLQFYYFYSVEQTLDEAQNKFGWKSPPSGQTTKILLFEVLALLMHKMHANLFEKCKLISKRKFTVIVVKWKKKKGKSIGKNMFNCM